jgi:hypothetical protein
MNVQKIISQYEKEMVAIYGPGIKKPVATDLLNEALAKISELDSTLAKLYETVKTNGGVLVEPGEFGEVPEEEEEVTEPDIKIFSGELPPPYEEKEAEDEAIIVKPTVAIMSPDDIIKQYENRAERDTFIGDILNDEQKEFNELLSFMDTNWNKKQSYSAKVLQNISAKLLSISNYYVDKNGVGIKQRIPSIKALNTQETRDYIMRELMKIYVVAVQNRALDRIEASKAKAGPPTVPPSPKGPPTAPTPPKAPTAPPSPQGAPPKAPPKPPMDINEVVAKLQNKKYKGDLITEFMNTDDPIQTMNEFFKVIEDADNKLEPTKQLLRRTWVNINEPSIKINATDLAPPKAITDAELKPQNFDASVRKVKIGALEILDKLIKQQAGPGRKRKSRKRPAIKSVKKLSADVNNQILRLLKS